MARVVRRLAAARRQLRIAGFIPADGEVDVRAALLAAYGRGARLYLPVVKGPGGPLGFRRWRPGQALVRNRFGIPEPRREAPSCSARHLDLVLVPLVGFDTCGNRLGMGGGFYDRTFADPRPVARWRRPRLVGVAYAGQQVAALPRRPWDVPVDAVVTERGLMRAKRPKTSRGGTG